MLTSQDKYMTATFQLFFRKSLLQSVLEFRCQRYNDAYVLKYLSWKVCDSFILSHCDFVLGAAHGLSSILQMLLSCNEFINSDPDAARDIRTSVDFFLSLMQPNGNIAPAMDEVGSRAHRPATEELVHWCHGAPGNCADFVFLILMYV